MSACLLFGLAGVVVGAPIGIATHAASSTDLVADPYVPGRSEDARVSGIAFRLATHGIGNCPRPVPATGFALQHLTQFELPDRAAEIAGRSLDRGPGVTLVVPGSPAAAAGMMPGDVLIAIDGVALPPEPGTDLPFAAPRAHARADAILDRIDRAATRPFTLTVLRGNATTSLSITPSPACPSRVHLARSNQRNAFADGTHVFLTTGLVLRLRSDDELAFFIAHEMAHNILDHAAVMRSDTVRRGLGRTLGRSGEIIRGVERDADMLAGRMMLAAGYDPVAGVGALVRMDDGFDNVLGASFAEHASPKDRVAAMQALVQAQARATP